MSLSIHAISAPSLLDTVASGSAASASGGEAFQNVLSSVVNQVESTRTGADAATQNFLSGTNEELHSTILASQNAELDFEMFLQVRNKVVSAYEEIMKMQV